MFNKITAIFTFFTIFQLIEVAHGESVVCSIQVNADNNRPCDFVSKNQTECIDVGTKISANFGCQHEHEEDGCWNEYRVCNQSKIELEFNSYCAGLNGTIRSDVQGQQTGACISNEIMY